jgi:hypothetical protein
MLYLQCAFFAQEKQTHIYCPNTMRVSLPTAPATVSERRWPSLGATIPIQSHGTFFYGSKTAPVHYWLHRSEFC